MPFAPVPCVCLCGLPGVCFILWILIQCHFSLKSFQLWISGDLGIVWRVPSTIIVSVHVQVCTCVYACICNMCMYVCMYHVYVCISMYTHIYAYVCSMHVCVVCMMLSWVVLYFLTTSCCRMVWYNFYPCPRISCFLKEPGSLLLDHSVRPWDLGALCGLISKFHFLKQEL